MSSDDAYSSFLEKANQPPGGASIASTSRSKPQSHRDLTAQSSSSSSSSPSNIPSVLKSLNTTYTSESDEPFEPFSVSYSGSSLPTAADFAKVIEHEKGESGVEELSVGEWDPRGEYGEVVGAVKEAAGGKGEVRCFKVEAGGGTRVVYYVVGLDGGEGRLVGVGARSVES